MSAWPYTGKLVYALLVYFVWGVVSSFWNIPYGTMLNSLTTRGDERTQLSNFRSIGSTGANVLVTTIAPLLIFNSVNEPQSAGFLILSIVLGVFSVLCLWGTHKLTHERVAIARPDSQERIQYLKVLASFARNRPMIAIMASYIVFKFTVQTIPIMNQYVFMSYFQNTTILSAIGLGTLIPLVLGMLVLKPMVARFGKRNLTTWPLLIAASLYLALAILPVSPVMWIVIEMICSFCYGFFMLMLWAMIADAVHYQAVLTRQRNDGIVYSTVTFVVFMVASLSTSFIAIVLDVLGYQPELQAEQTAQVALNLRIAAGLLPSLGCLLVFLIFRYVNNISDARMEEIREEARTIAGTSGDSEEDASSVAAAPSADGSDAEPTHPTTRRHEGETP